GFDAGGRIVQPLAPMGGPRLSDGLAGSLLALQRSVGNSAVAQLVQRCPGCGGTCGCDDEEPRAASRPQPANAVATSVQRRRAADREARLDAIDGESEQMAAASADTIQRCPGCGGTCGCSEEGHPTGKEREDPPRVETVRGADLRPVLTRLAVQRAP